MAGFGPYSAGSSSRLDPLLQQRLSRRGAAAVRKPAFEYPFADPGENTRIDYQISDDGMKLRTSVVLSGRIGRDEAEEIERLFSGKWHRAVFEPSHFHLPDLTDLAADMWPLSGRQYHHVTRMAPSDAAADRSLPTSDQFAEIALGHPGW